MYVVKLDICSHLHHYDGPLTVQHITSILLREWFNNFHIYQGSGTFLGFVFWLREKIEPWIRHAERYGNQSSTFRKSRSLMNVLNWYFDFLHYPVGNSDLVLIHVNKKNPYPSRCIFNLQSLWSLETKENASSKKKLDCGAFREKAQESAKGGSLRDSFRERER